jgi:protein-tyrosine phosphatase
MKAAAAFGLDLQNHRTQEVNLSLLNGFDLIVVMEEGHRQALVTEFPQMAGKILVLGQLASVPGNDIPDPAKSAFSKPEETAALVCSSIQRTFSKLVQFTLLQHDGYSALKP